MLAAKPVVAAAGGATLELVHHGFNGLLYESGSHQSLAEKIVYLLQNPSECERLGDNGLRWAKAQFGKAKYAKDVLSVLDEASNRLNKTPRGGESRR